MIKSLNKNIIDVKTFGLAVKTVKSYGKTVWEKSVPEPATWGGLTFTALEAGEIGMTHNGTNATTTKPNLSYSKNGGEWVEWDYTNIPVVKDDKVYLKGVNDNLCSVDDMFYFVAGYSKFTSTGKIAGSGNIMSLLYGDDFEGKIDLSGKTYCFYYLFYNCSNLTTAPALPATTLANDCYDNMFYGCTSLTTSPELPATTLAENCYITMFSGCTSLTAAPELPATELVMNCYNSMFLNCTSLTTAPELPATTLAEYCYTSMFENCTNLNYVKAKFTTEPSNTYTRRWLLGVSSTGTFVANQEATWPSSVERNETTVPSGWTIQK